MKSKLFGLSLILLFNLTTKCQNFIIIAHMGISNKLVPTIVITNGDKQVAIDDFDSSVFSSSFLVSDSNYNTLKNAILNDSIIASIQNEKIIAEFKIAII